jgi:hypothetical protein
MNRSQCASAVGIRTGDHKTWMPQLSTSSSRLAEKVLCRSCRRNLQLRASERASRSCCRVHSAVGYSVTLKCTSRLDPISRATNTYRIRKLAVTEIKKSHAITLCAWFRRKVDHRWSLEPRGCGCCGMYLRTVRGESRTWSFSIGFSAAIRRISRLTSTETGGLPTTLDFQRQKRRKAIRCQPIKVAGFTMIKALRHSQKASQLGEHEAIRGCGPCGLLLTFLK